MAAINRFYSTTKYNTRTQFLSTGIKCVFISHQKNDKDSAKKVAEYLQNAGIEVYFDEFDKELRIHHQANNAKGVTNSICNGINNSSHMLVLVSPNTLSSTWVPFEIGYGYDKTDLGVLCLKGIPKGGLPEYVRTCPIVRDIYDFNNYVSRVGGGNSSVLVASKITNHFSHYANPLASVMDSNISDLY